MKIAIVGTGVSAMVCARILSSRHEITVYEAADYVGGHTHTHSIPLGGRTWPVDTGFIVFNDWTYPNFIRLLEILGVPSRASDMSFSVRSRASGLEYNGTSLNTLFAQRSNLFRPSFHRMIRDILRFNREAPRLLESEDDSQTLGEYLTEHRYSSQFLDHYVLPMGGAIWSASSDAMRSFPARYFVQFFHNHGMLSVDERPQWRTVIGGSQSYMKALIAPFRDRIRLSTPVASIRRFDDRVEVASRAGVTESFDHVVVGAHSDQALAMLSDASPVEREVLGAIPYQENLAVLHTDERVMPRRKLAWAAWNYHLGADRDGRVAVSYWMNRLQGLDAPANFCVTLNDTSEIDPAKVLRRLRYHHPVYTRAGVAAQKRWADVNGKRRTWFCGAWWSFGFHEDGVKSALRVAHEFGLSLEDVAATPTSARTGSTALEAAAS